jgi:hypothetical protein
MRPIGVSRPGCLYIFNRSFDICFRSGWRRWRHGSCAERGRDPGAGTLNFVPSAEAVEFLGMTAYVDINWSKNWTSSLVSSFTKVDNANFQVAAAFHMAEYASANNLWHRLKMC